MFVFSKLTGKLFKNKQKQKKRSTNLKLNVFFADLIKNSFQTKNILLAPIFKVYLHVHVHVYLDLEIFTYKNIF